MSGYLGQPPLVPGEWFPTGDLGYLTDAGLVVCGRIKELITVAGRNLFPSEIERVAARCAASVRAPSSQWAPKATRRARGWSSPQSSADPTRPVREPIWCSGSRLSAAWYLQRWCSSRPGRYHARHRASSAGSKSARICMRCAHDRVDRCRHR